MGMENLVSIKPDGSPPASRITDASAAYQIWGTLRQGDYTSALQRARVDAMFDGKQPYDQAQLNATGQSFRTNVNFDFAGALLEVANAGYNDLINSVKKFFTCPTTYGSEVQRREWEEIIAEEITETIRDWDDFEDTYQRCVNDFLKHGVSISYFNDESDWRWLATNLSDFKIPRKTKIGQSNIDVACYLRFYSPTELYGMITHPHAKELGYNYEVGKTAIQQCVNNANNFIGYSNYDWEKIEVAIKNNDLFFANGTADAQSIRVVNLIVTEYPKKGEPEGRVSHFQIIDDNQVSQFLYKKIGRFDNVYQAYTVFTFGTGTNGFYQGVRGLGWKIFEQVNSLNRLWCNAMDGTMLSSTVMLQPEDEDDAQALQFSYYGPFSIISSKLNFVERPMMPNVAQTVYPVIQGMREMLRDKTGAYNTQQFINDNREKTKFQVQAELASAAKMSISALNMFYSPWQRHLREVVRRMKRRTYSVSDPGGKYIIELKRRLLQRKVPLEAFYNLDVNRLKAVRAVGSGSEAARMLAYDRLMQMRGVFDAEGQNNLDRDIIGDLLGYEYIERYKPRLGNDRPVMDVSIAQLESNQLLNGGIVMVLPNQNHLEHAKVHAQYEMPLIQQVEEMLTVDPMAVAGTLPGLQLLNAHLTEHVLIMSQDDNLREESAQFRQLLQAADEVIHNGTLKIQKLQEQQAMQAQSEGEQFQPEIDPDTLAKIEKDRALTAAKIENINALTAAKAQSIQMLSNQKAAIEDVKAAQQLTNQAAKNRQSRRANAQ